MEPLHSSLPLRAQDLCDSTSRALYLRGLGPPSPHPPSSCSRPRATLSPSRTMHDTSLMYGYGSPRARSVWLLLSLAVMYGGMNRRTRPICGDPRRDVKAPPCKLASPKPETSRGGRANLSAGPACGKASPDRAVDRYALANVFGRHPVPGRSTQAAVDLSPLRLSSYLHVGSFQAP